MTIPAYEPAYRLRFRSVEAPFPFAGSWELEPIDGPTRVVYRAQGEVGGFFRLTEGGWTWG